MRVHPLSPAFLLALFLPTFAFAEDPPPDFKKIVLPPNPTRSDISKFLKDLDKEAFGYSEQTKLFANTRIPELHKNITLKLNEIPSDHIDLILEKTPTFPGYKLIQGAYTRSVIFRTDLTEKHAQIIASRLQKHADLIEVIDRYGWAPLFEKQITKAAKTNADNYLVPKYAEALARINTEDSAETLSELLARGSAMSMTNAYYAVHRLSPDRIDWAKTVAQAWENAKQDPDYVQLYAPIAAAYGHTDALILIAKKLNSNSVGTQGSPANNRVAMWHALLQLVDVQLPTSDELVQYVLDHREQLVFDGELGVYMTK